MNARGLLIACLTCAALAAALAAAASAQAARSGQTLAQGSLPGESRGKVSSHLRPRSAQLRSSTPFVEAAPPKTVEVRLDRLDAALLQQLSQAGMRIEGYSLSAARVYGQCPQGALAALAAIEEVVSVQPQWGGVSSLGLVTSQADSSIRADVARADFGVDGSGVQVGVLSDSFNSLIGGAVAGAGCNRTLTGSFSQGNGDLPPQVILLDNGPGGIDEGAGMAELIHDLAPGADLLFHTSLPNIATMADGIRELAACGADVIVDDFIFFAEPMFQDGLIAQAAQDVSDSGIAYFSSAGNNASAGVDENFADSVPAIDDFAFPASGNDFHDFGGGDRFAAITVPGGGCGIRLVLQWDEPYDGVLGPGASNDLDLYLCVAEDPAACLFSSADGQGCSLGLPQAGDPLEIAAAVNNGPGPATIFAAVESFCGNEDLRFRIVPFGINCSLGSGYVFEQPIFSKAQIYGHAAAAGANAVAAADYREIDAAGNFSAPPGQIDVEPFSSLGGDLPFFFDRTGSPLPGGPQLRSKPEMTAPDNTNTSFFPPFLGADADGDGFPNFSGTSAAAPHAAAVAALIRQIDPSLDPAQIRDALVDTALDIESPGFDFLSGAGLIDAADALEEVRRPVRPVLECVTNNGNGTFTALFGYKNDNPTTIAIPIGRNNKFTPRPQDRGQPTSFLPGRHRGVFSVGFNGGNLVWTLSRRTSTASANSQSCGP